jgi:subtilisin family serine protease
MARFARFSHIALLTILWLPGMALAQELATEFVNGKPAVAREVLVQFKAVTPDQLNQLAGQFDVESSRGVGRTGFIRIRSRSQSAAALLRAFSRHPLVDFVEPNYVVHTTDTIPNDAQFNQLYGLQNTGQTINGVVGFPFADMGAIKAWDITTGSRNVVVAITDTGIDYQHPDLVANVWTAPKAFNLTFGSTTYNCPAGSRGFNLITLACDPNDDNFHGTHVAGMIGASGNNQTGVAGVNWQVSLLSLKFLGPYGSGSVADGINAIAAAVQLKQQGVNIRVINASWGTSTYTASLLAALNDAAANDILVVAAAGNNGLDTATYAFYPANFNLPNLLSVAATDNQDKLADYSNYNSELVHIAAPGSSILSTSPNNDYRTLSGTSMATAYVSGAAALLLSSCPVSTGVLRSAILNSVDKLPSLTGKVSSEGRLQVARALNFCRTTPLPDFTITASPSILAGNSGTLQQSTLGLNPFFGFNSPVNLAVSGLPSGITATLTPSTISGTIKSTLSLQVGQSTARGEYPILVRGTSGTNSTVLTIPVSITVPDFEISVSASFPSFGVGGSTQLTTSIAAIGGFSSIVNLSAVGVPPGVTVSFGPPSITASGSSVVTITSTPTASLGTFLVTIQGTSGALLRSTSISLTILPPPDFTISASPNLISFGAGGGSAQTSIALQPTNGYGGSVTLSVSGLPNGVSAVFQPATLQRTGTSALTIGSTTSITPGNYTLTVTASDGTLTRSTPLSLQITPQPALTLPSTLQLNPGDQTVLNINLATPAPSGGVLVSLSNSDSSIASTNLTSVLILGGQSSTTRVLVNALRAGIATISATAPGYVGTTATIQVGSTNLAITTTSLPSGQVGSNYSFNLAATNGTPPYKWTLIAGSLPPTLALSTGGLISGTPGTAVTSTPLTFRVTDSGSPAQTAETTLALTVTAPAAGRTITASSGSGQSATLNSAFSLPLQALVRDGSSNPVVGVTVTFSAPTSGASGSFAGFGTIATAITNASGIATTPTFTANGVSGSFNITATVSGASSPAAFSLTNVAAAAINLPTALNVAVGAQSALPITLSSPATGSVFVTLSVSDPTIASLNTSAVLISEGETGSTRVRVNGLRSGVVTILASASAYLSGTTQLSVGSPTLAINTTSLPQGRVGQPYSFTLDASNGTKPYTWTLIGGTLPANLQLSSAGLISGTPAGTFSGVLTFRVTDASSPAQSAFANLTLTVAAASIPSSIAMLSGSPQSTGTGASFGSALQAIVKDADGNPVSGAAVTFTAPASGASCSFAGQATAVAITNSAGVATSPVPAANSVAGTYSVNATVTGVAAPAAFSLTNVSGPAISLPATLSIDAGGQAVLTITLSQPAPAGGLFVNIDSTNPAVAAALQTPTYIAEGLTTSTRARISGFAAGTALLTVSAAGFSPAASSVTVTR